MARIDAARGRHGGGSRFRVAVLALIVLAAVVGMTSLQSTGLHADLHSRTAHEELRAATGALRAAVDARPPPPSDSRPAAPPRCCTAAIVSPPRRCHCTAEGTSGAAAEEQLQEEPALEAADGLAAGGGEAAGGTRTFEHTFETSDGTDADQSLQPQDAARAVAGGGGGAAADEINTTPGGCAGRCEAGCCLPAAGCLLGAGGMGEALTPGPAQARSTTWSAPWATECTLSGSRAWCVRGARRWERRPQRRGQRCSRVPTPS